MFDVSKDFERMQLIAQLEDYVPYDAVEAEHKKEILESLRVVEDVFWRKCEKPGHVTASAWVVNPTYTKVLLQYHKYRHIWMPSGGHADGCMVPVEVAQREFYEEVGSMKLMLLKPIFDVDTHPVPINEKKGEGEHRHLDFRVLLAANDNEPFPVSPEGIEGRWFTLEEAYEEFKGGVGRLRCLHKIMDLRAAA